MIPIDEVIKNDERQDELDKILKRSTVNMLSEYSAPENAIQVMNNGEWQRLLTLGNFSTISGKQKSKKTFLTTLLMAAASGSNRQGAKFKGCLPKDKSICWFFDTEQSLYDSWTVGKRITYAGGNINNINILSLRPYSPKERLEVIGYVLEKHKDKTGFAVIDGIADLVNSVNDEVEAIAVTTDLLKWTELYNIHVSTVIHQRKADGYARGHIGTSVMNKSESVISVTKDESFPSKSLVKNTDQRGVMTFDSFEIEIIEGRLVIGENIKDSVTF